VELVLDAPVLTEETAGMRDQGSFLSCWYRVGVLALTVIT
jgi:hypothetical protein